MSNKKYISRLCTLFVVWRHRLCGFHKYCLNDCFCHFYDAFFQLKTEAKKLFSTFYVQCVWSCSSFPYWSCFWIWPWHDERAQSMNRRDLSHERRDERDTRKKRTFAEKVQAVSNNGLSPIFVICFDATVTNLRNHEQAAPKSCLSVFVYICVVLMKQAGPHNCYEPRFRVLRI